MITQIGPYLIDEELAQGGMARVFRARLRGLGGFEKTLVLKQIRSELSKDPRFVELFVREANTLVQLVHPHIVPVYELGAVDGTYYLAMEYIEGATLAEILRDGPLGHALAAQIGVQVADALDYAHARFGILHRDVTPRNLIVDDAGHVRLLDFGIAAALDDSGSETLGSPGYMSPEQVSGGALSPASDLFSLGVVLYEALAGRAPFEKTTRGTLGAATPLSRQPEVPKELSSLVDRMIAKEPRNRPESAAEVSRLLRAWLAQAHPEGVFEALRARTRKARARLAQQAQVAREAAQKALGAPTKPIGTAGGVRTIATSRVLTEMLRSAPGSLMPEAPAPEGGGTRKIEREPSTQRIAREPTAQASAPSLPEPAENKRAEKQSARATAWMMRSWPTLAGLSFVLALALMWARPQEKPKQETPKVEPPAELQPKPDVAPREEPKPPENKLPSSPDAGPARTSLPDSEKATRDEPVRDESEGRAFLSLSALPWAEVSVDGHVLGTTPLRATRIKPGTHTLVFSCPPLGKTERLVVNVPKDARARIVVDLSKDPPGRILDGVSELR